MGEFYVYVYIDPRNFEEFYYGKGKRNRKNSHLEADDESEKSLRIRSIKEDGLFPIIRVIATNLKESEALLIEATLIWKLGKYTTNIQSGHFKNKFRPDNTLYKDIPRFDYKNGLFYYVVGEGEHRNWDDYIKYGIISAGQGVQWRDQIIKYNEDDIIVAYLRKNGYVGVGKIISKAKPISKIKIDGKPLLECVLSANMASQSDDYENCEYVCLVDWIKTFDRKNSKWKAKNGLFSNSSLRASLAEQGITIKYIEKEFDINFAELLK